MSRHPTIVALALAATFLVATAILPVRAEAAGSQESELKARTHFAAGEYKEALDIYARLYAETLHPTYLRNIARCHQNLGDADKAITSFREYLRKAKDLTPEQRAEVEGYIAEMEALKRAQASPAAPTPPPVPLTPTAAPPPAAPPPAATETAQPVLIGPPTITAVSADDGEARPLYTRWWFWVIVGGVAVAGAATTLLLAGGGDPAHGNLGVVDLTDNTP